MVIVASMDHRSGIGRPTYFFYAIATCEWIKRDASRQAIDSSAQEFEHPSTPHSCEDLDEDVCYCLTYGRPGATGRARPEMASGDVLAILASPRSCAKPYDLAPSTRPSRERRICRM